jgi:hypothetical protein
VSGRHQPRGGNPPLAPAAAEPVQDRRVTITPPNSEPEGEAEPEPAAPQTNGALGSRRRRGGRDGQGNNQTRDIEKEFVALARLRSVWTATAKTAGDFGTNHSRLPSQALMGAIGLVGGFFAISAASVFWPVIGTWQLLASFPVLAGFVGLRIGKDGSIIRTEIGLEGRLLPSRFELNEHLRQLEAIETANIDVQTKKRLKSDQEAYYARQLRSPPPPQQLSAPGSQDASLSPNDSSGKPPQP